MRIRFDEQLELLNRKLIEMGALCEDAISASMHTLKNEADKKSAEKAAALEREIDHKEREIESLCMKLLLQQQPVARDLRTISSALKMISDLERIGDQASDIAGITGYIEDEQLKSGTHIYEMARAASRMVTDSVDSFVRKDLGKARAVQKEDDIVDGLFDTVKNELVGQITEHPDLSGEELTLTLKEYELLHLMLEHPMQVFTRDRLLSSIWGYEFDGESRTVDVHIRSLRLKLGAAGGQIETVRGVGYRLRETAV